MRTPQLIALVALAAIWGASFMFIKVMLEEMGPVAVGWVRLGGGAAVLFAVLGARRTALPRAPRRWADIAVVGLLGTAIPFVLIPWGEQEIDSGLAGVLNASMPLFVVVLAAAARVDEPISRARAGGLALGFVGVIVVIGPDLLEIASAGTQGQLAVVVASLSYAAGAVYTRRFLLGMDSTLLAGGQTIVAFVLLTPLLLAAESVPELPELSRRVLLASAALAFLSTGVAFVIYYWLLATASAMQASLVTYLAPAAALFWGWLVLDERLALSIVPGLALIAAGIYLANRPAAARAEASTRPA